ncbi:CAP-Gly domain-containing linker protein 1-like isoform X2 [Artemia franciscana]|uniref:CAP-Gly domain-containing protein n=1 Tax=Artemia franciscana TaxID=6661 RepID=A0AA88L6S6_ARTSF|nr:hypothetical protein QYM36_009107 [Artemia franciscana]
MSHIPKPTGLRAPTTKVPKTDTGNKENVSKNAREDGSRRNSEIRKASDVSSAAQQALFEQQRKLSEAGVGRRMSDVSVVLTTDTDSFIVGDRVWVGGTKPGHIQFIGETQFAPGEWAGVVLDETIGKNDGSVGGVKYFQCAPKRGVFSRLSRLTREPIDLPDESIFQPPDGNAASTPVRKTPERCISPSSSICSRKSSSPFTGNATLGGSMNSASLAVGERVIVTSMQGSKTGVLRYLGLTEFAQGQWAGVELDEPDGKNDGSVAGKRYFECKPKHGLFTPASKVFRSPANAMRKVSAYKMTRQSSRDSMQSMLSNTSRMSNFTSASIRRPSRPSMNTTLSAQQAALQETIREKEKHIEQILKERELDRAEAARALIAASDAQKKLAELEEKVAKTHEKAGTVERLMEQLAAGEAVSKELLSQLEDERRKNEDQQFRFEEESICKTELEAVIEANQKKINDLENQVKSDKVRIEEYEKQSKEEGEKIEESVKLREKIKNLEEALKLEKNELNRILVEHVKEIEELEEKNLEKVKKEKECLQMIIDETKGELTKALIRHDEESKEIEEGKLCLQAENDKLKKDIEKVNYELANINFNKTDENDKTVKELNLKNELIIKLKSELDELKNVVIKEKLEVENKINNATVENEKLKELVIEKDLAIDKLSLAKMKIDTSQDENDKLVDDLKNQLEKSQSELINTLSENQKLKEVSNEKDSAIDILSAAKVEIEKTLESNKKMVNDLNDQLETSVNEIKLKSSENEELKAKLELEIKETTEKYESQIRNLVIKLTTFEEEIKSGKENLIKCLKDNEDGKIQFERELDLLRKEAKSLDQAKSLLEEEKKRREEELVEVKNKLANRDNERMMLEQKVSSLEVANSTLTKEIENLIQSCGSFKEEKEVLNSRLEELENLRIDLARKNQASEELGARLKEELEELRKIYKDEKQKLEEEIEDFKGKLSTSEANLVIQIKSRQDLEAKLQSADNTLLKDLSLANEKLTNFQQENCELSAKIKSLENVCEKFRSENEQNSLNLKAKHEDLRCITHTLSETKQKLKDLSASSEKEIGELQSRFDASLSECSKLNCELNDYKNQIENIKEQIINVENEKVLILADKNAEITEIREGFKKAEHKVSEMESLLSNREKELAKKEQKLLILSNENATLSTDLESEKLAVANLTYKFDAENCEKVDLIVKLSEKDQKLAELSNENATLAAAIMTEKKLLATLSDKFEFENSDKVALLSKLSSLELELSENKSQVVKLNAELVSYKAQYDSNLVVIKDRDNEIQNLKSSLSAASESLSKSQIEAENKAKKLDLLEKQLSQLTSKIVGLGEVATQLEQSLVAASKEKAELIDKIERLEREIVTLSVDGNKLSDLESQNQGLQMELERLKVELSSKEVICDENVKEKENAFEKIRNEFEDLKRNLDSETKKRKELENEKIMLGGIINEKEKFIKDLESQTEEIKSIFNETERKLNERISKAEEETHIIALKAKEERTYLATVKGEIEVLKLEKEELIKKIADLEKTCSDTKKDLLLVESTGEEKMKLVLEKDNLMKRLLSVEENASTAVFSYEEEKLNLLESLEAVKKELEIKTFENRELLNKIQSFNGEISRVSSLKSAISLSDKEKHQLNLKIDKLQEQLKKAQEECAESYQGTDEQTLMLRESKKNLEQQVSFLNSVIIDMQKKNENLKTEMEILRATLMGHGVTDHNSNRRNGIPNHRSSKPKLPPRLYCDICEAFDTHDTEDCPTQSSEAYLADQQVGQDPKKVKSSDRPYCETCEIFGHTTEECQDGESF